MKTIKTDDDCINCGAPYGLHHSETEACPLDGVEAVRGEQQYQSTTFEREAKADATTQGTAFANFQKHIKEATMLMRAAEEAPTPDMAVRLSVIASAHAQIATAWATKELAECAGSRVDHLYEYGS